MKMSNPFIFALILSAASATSAAALSCNNKHPELCRKADLIAEIQTYGTVNATGQFSVKSGVSLNQETHFMNLATNKPVTVGQLVTMMKLGAINGDGSFNSSSPLNLGFDSAATLTAPTTPTLPAVGQTVQTPTGTPKSELSSLGTFNSAGQFTLNRGVAPSQNTNFYSVNPNTGKTSPLNAGQVQLFIRMGAIKKDGSIDPTIMTTAIVYRPPAPANLPGMAIDPNDVSQSGLNNMLAGQPGTALAAAQINQMIDASGRPKSSNGLTSFYSLKPVNGHQIYVQLTQRELAQAIAAGLINRDGTARQDPSNGWGSAGRENTSIPVVVFLPTPSTPGPSLTPTPTQRNSPSPQAPPLMPQLTSGMTPTPAKTQALTPQLMPLPDKAHKWSSTTPQKPMKNDGRTIAAKHKDKINQHFSNSRVDKPSDCVTGGHGRQGSGVSNHCMLSNDVVMECLTSGQRRRTTRGPDGSLNGVGLTESFRSVDEDVNSAPANHTFSSSCMISIQRPHL